MSLTGNILTINNSITTTGGGPVSFANAGLLTINGNIVSDGAVSQSGAGAVTITAPRTISTTGDTVNFLRAVTLSGGGSGLVSINTTVTVATGANISFQNTLNATTAAPNAEQLTLNAGTLGTVTFTLAVGSTTRLGAITVTNANNLTQSAGLTAASFVQNAGQGTTLFSGVVNTNAAAGVSLTGNIQIINNSITTTGGGPVSFANAGLLTINGNIVSDGAVSQSGAGAVTITAPRTISTTGDAVNFLRTVSLNGGGAGLVTIDTTITEPAGANITFQNAVNAMTTGASAERLTLTAGTGAILVSGIIGGIQALSSLTLTADAGITLSGIGLGAAGVAGTVNATTAGFISLNSADYLSTGTQIWTAGSGVRYRGSAPGPWNWSAGGPGIQLGSSDLFIDHTVASLSINSAISVRNLYFYRGQLSLGGTTLTVTENLAVFGSAYSPNDPDRNGTHPANVFHRYPAAPSLAYYPGGGTYNGGTSLFSVGPSASFQPLDGATISVGGNFYVNGTNMEAGALWTLILPSNDGSAPQGNPAAFSWGTPYAVALNMTVSNSVVTGGWVNAAAGLPAGPGPSYATEHNNGVQDNGGNTNWQFLRPQIRVASTVYDDVIRISFEDNDGNPMLIENSNGEISAAVALAVASSANGSFWYHWGALKFDTAYTDAEATNPLGVGDVHTFYIKTTTTRWNTDATGSSPGAALSTDRGRPGIAPAHRTIIPNLTMLKGILFAANGKTPAVNYGLNGFAIYNGTLDECRPVLIGVELGQAAHAPNNPAPPAWDAHNYIQLRWSEPVSTGAMDQSAVNEKSSSTFSLAPGQWGGALSGSTLAGFAAFQTAAFSLGARSNAEAPDDEGLQPAQVNGLYRGGPNAYGDHGLYVSVAGWSYLSGGIRFWPGYFASTPVPPAGTVTVPLNSGLLDFAGNVIETTANPYDKTEVVVQPGPWDTVPPTVARDLLPMTEFFDIVPLATFNEIDKFELRFSKAVRDSSFYYTNSAPTGLVGGLPGFVFRDEERETDFRFGATGFDTNVTSPAFGGPVNVTNDALITMTPVPINPLWTPTSQMSFLYTQAVGLVTDLAGNLLPSYLPTSGEVFLCVERIPPNIRFTLANVGGNDLYLQFTEPVWRGVLNDLLGRVFTPSDFILAGAPSATIAEVVVITPEENEEGNLQPVTEVLLRFTEPLTTQFSLEARLSLSSDILDRAGTSAQESVVRRAVDLATGVVEVLGASDGIHLGNPVATQSDLGTGSLGLLRVFDGSGRLYDRDTTIFTSLDLSGEASSTLPLQLYFDAGEPSSGVMTVPITGREDQPGLFWLPSYFSGFNLNGNSEARVLSPFRIGDGGLSRNFLVPASDPEIVPGARVNFLFRYGDLWLARTSSATDPLQFDLWRYRIEDIVRQRGGVTILNNVIDSNKRERTALQVELAEAGQVSVMVFTLDGDVVRTLHRGRLAAGTYSMTWDGSNSAGRPVARGMYFIRVVAPGIDEIRKVMVIKN